MTCAPVTLFVYNRPDHTRRTVEALRANILANESDLIVYSDAPKTGAQADKVREVRSYVRGIQGFKSLTIVERETNYGLARSIIDGVTRVVNRYDSVIVLEDDMVTSPYFLRFMNDALNLYEQEHKVISIHGYMFPVGELLPETFFMRGADCWGWATWKRGWDLFESDGNKLLSELFRQKLTWRFDLDGVYPYTQMLKDQIDGRNDSWAIRWQAAAFLANRLTLYPRISLLQNIGFDASGTHCSKTDNFNVELAESPISVLPCRVEECVQARDALIRYYRAQKRGVIVRIAKRALSMLGL